MTYTPPTLTGYDGNFAPDDGSQIAGNQITLAGVVNNLTDPLRTYIAAISTAITTAFSQLLLGQTSTKTGNFSVSATNDPGKVFSCTNALTVSLPAASAAGDGFNCVIYNNSAGAIIIDPNSTELVNGAATITLDKKYSACILVCNGTAWYALIINQFLLNEVTLASATTTDLATALSNNVSITGTTTITSFGSAALTANPIYFLKFTGALILTYNATSLIIPGSANITTAAGDTAIVEYLGSGNWRVRSYTKLTGRAIISPLSEASFPNMVLYGGVLSNGSDATNDINISAGAFVSDDGTTVMTLSAIVKQLDAAWAVGTNQGGLDTGSIANTTYHLWAINRPDTNVTDVLFSASPTTPTMPTNYTKKKRIGSVVRVGGALKLFTQYDMGGGTVQTNYAIPVAASTTNNPGTSAVLQTLADFPAGVKFKALMSFTLTHSAGLDGLVTSPDQTDTTPTTILTNIFTDGADPKGVTFNDIITNTSAQIRYRLRASTASTNITAVTHGFIDFRTT